MTVPTLTHASDATVLLPGRLRLSDRHAICGYSLGRRCAHSAKGEKADRGWWAMKPKSTPELLLEAEEAYRLAELTVGVGEELMERVKEVSHRIEDRVRQVTSPTEA